MGIYPPKKKPVQIVVVYSFVYGGQLLKFDPVSLSFRPKLLQITHFAGRKSVPHACPNTMKGEGGEEGSVKKLSKQYKTFTHCN